jgi:hypothetical protein
LMPWFPKKWILSQNYFFFDICLIQLNLNSLECSKNY